MERFVIFPIQHQSIYKLYQKQKLTLWVAEEIDFSKDRQDFESLKPQEQKMLKHVLAFFAASDAIVNENVMSRFMIETPFRESQLFYGMQTASETSHIETYGLNIQECIRDKQEQDDIFRAVMTMDGVKRKSQWAVDYLESKTASFAERLIAYVIVEGIFFQNAFAIIFGIKDKYPGKLPGTVFANELISIDERLHTDHNVEQYRLLDAKDKISKDRAFAIFKSAYEMEVYFIRGFMDDILGMNSVTQTQHTEYMCDFWLEELGFEKMFGTKNPYPFMDLISLRPRTNFFERRNREYSRGKSVDATIQATSYDGNSMDI